MTTTLITGANKGLGAETARQLVAAGHDVWIGARNGEAGRRVAADLGARFVALDVTSDASVGAAVATLDTEVGHLDVLVNNAGIIRGPVRPSETTTDDLTAVLDTNVVGVLRVTNAFLPLLERSPAAVVVNVSSGLGSLGLLDDPGSSQRAYPDLAYPVSKAALDMLTRRYAIAHPGIRWNAANPGFTATDLNDNSGTQTVAEGAEPIVALATIGADGPTGTFLGRHGAVPW